MNAKMRLRATLYACFIPCLIQLFFEKFQREIFELLPPWKNRDCFRLVSVGILGKERETGVGKLGWI